MTLEELQKERKRLNKRLAPHFKGKSLINDVWREYNEDTSLGNMLRRRDKVCIQIYKKGNGCGQKE
jgi:hypothetical protein